MSCLKICYGCWQLVRCCCGLFNFIPREMTYTCTLCLNDTRNYILSCLQLLRFDKKKKIIHTYTAEERYLCIDVTHFANWMVFSVLRGLIYSWLLSLPRVARHFLQRHQCVLSHKNFHSNGNWMWNKTNKKTMNKPNKILHLSNKNPAARKCFLSYLRCTFFNECDALNGVVWICVEISWKMIEEMSVYFDVDVIYVSGFFFVTRSLTHSSNNKCWHANQRWKKIHTLYLMNWLRDNFLRSSSNAVSDAAQ